MTDPLGLRRSLLRDLADQVDAAVDEWAATDKVAQVWARDASVWTGKDEDAWLGWLDVAHLQAADAWFWTEVTGWIGWHRSIRWRSKFDTPICSANPSRTTSAIAPHVSSTGIRSSGQRLVRPIRRQDMFGGL